MATESDLRKVMSEMEADARTQRYGQPRFFKLHAWTVTKRIYGGDVLILWYHDDDLSTHVVVRDLSIELADVAYNLCGKG